MAETAQTMGGADTIDPNAPIVADTFPDGQTDGDSAISVTVSSSLESLRSSVYQHQEENGRTYHALNAGKYVYPNDSRETERLELQHYLWLLTLKGELCLCPKAEGAKRVLDLGTGTGCWAIDYADLHPEAEVIGVDLSPIQPTMVPANCSFEIDDLEKEWTWSKPFDFLFSRVLTGSLADMQECINKAYNALEPGGWFEMQDILLPYMSDDGSLDPETELGQVSPLCIEASAVLGRPLDQAWRFGEMMEKAGFENITKRRFKWPLNTWPRDPHYKEMGAAFMANLDSGLEGLFTAPFTRGLKWSLEDTLAFCVQVRRQLKNRNIHAYLPILVLYGQKPMGS